MRSLLRFLFAATLLACALGLSYSAAQKQSPSTVASGAYLGFDLNEYPGDDALPVLRKTFSFASYWLGPPPGEKRSSWLAKRAVLQSQGFGFVVLFTGKATREVISLQDALREGASQAQEAATLARQDGFPQGSVIFLDVEEGGRLPLHYHEYLQVWYEALAHAGFRAGVYCSGVPVKEGPGVTITTAEDIHAHMGSRAMVYWVFNDACPPAPGCAFPANPPPPSHSGFSAATIWQYAQSPRRKERTAKCPANYARDGNCYAPGDAQHRWLLDANVASTPDPSASH